MFANTLINMYYNTTSLSVSQQKTKLKLKDQTDIKLKHVITSTNILEERRQI